MNRNRLLDYVDHIQQAAADVCSFVQGLAKDDFLAECAEAAEKAAAKGDPKRPEHYAEAIRVAVRRVAREWTGKKPVTDVQVTRL
jgi:hypothetical protein